MRSLMRLLYRRKRLLIGLAVGLLAGYLAWLFLPSEPSVIISERFDRVLFAPDGKTIATVRQLTHVPDVNALLAAGELLPDRHTQIRYWDAATLTEIRSIEMPRIDSVFAAFSPDSTKLAVLSREAIPSREHWWTAGETRLRIVHVGADEKKDDINSGSDDWPLLHDLKALFFSPDGEPVGLYCSSSRDRCELWNLRTREVISELVLPDWCTGKSLLLPIHSAPACIKLTRELKGDWGPVLAGCYPAIMQRPMLGRTSAHNPVAFAAGGRIFIEAPTWIKIWDSVDGGHRQLEFSNWRFLGRELVASPDARFLAIQSMEPSQMLWTKLRRWFGLPAQTSDVVFAYYLIDTHTERLINHFPDAEQAFFSPDSQRLAVVYEDRTEFWDLPLRPPWVKIVALGLASGLAILLFSLISRLFRRRRSELVATPHQSA